jgi:hypothetical protein
MPTTTTKADRRFILVVAGCVVAGAIWLNVRWPGDPNRPDCTAWGVRRITHEESDNGRLLGFKYKSRKDAESAADHLTRENAQDGDKWGYVVECVEWPGGGQ